jgi:hypothetical protein
MGKVGGERVLGPVGDFVASFGVDGPVLERDLNMSRRRPVLRTCSGVMFVLARQCSMLSRAIDIFPRQSRSALSKVRCRKVIAGEWLFV